MNTIDKVAVTSRSFSSNRILIEELKKRYKNISLNTSGKTLFGDELLEFLSGQEKVIVGLENFDKTLLDKLPDLKVVSKFGVGLNNIDLNAMSEKSISLGFKPGTNKQSVAELALMHILIALRKTPSSKEDIINNVWSQQKGNELFRKTIGIVGFGNIGQRLAELLEPFDCKVLFFDAINFTDNDLKNIFTNHSNIAQVSLENLLSESEIISIHIPLIKETHNLISNHEFNKMNQNIRIINTSRGGIVDETALLDFLKNNSNAFAAFDVFEKEPAFNHPLLKLNNFYATSHLGSMTTEGVVAMGLAAIDGLDQNTIPL